ncbi:hypothetical protein UA08_09460 [Talaromyces atroroseus]|uniref:Protein kinase domain-containing protein n=1 Tax=Talaromyces atroroseus TaxID=1441469 RepID=A0A225A4T8_TALAT|nr:hypothetical protein UA08_09460 [Talaromyces atroroseus]OKL55301.1 hypothetical protein UA08_09460 [Talaromyces atroroseus]
MSRKEASRNTILPKTLKDLRPTKDIPKPPPGTEKQSSPDDLLWKEEDPSMKYLLSHKFNQAGPGWIGFENCQGLRTVFVKVVKATRHQKLHFHKTDQANLINLQEVFHSKEFTYLIYDFDRCDLPLSMVHASPNVQFTEVDIAIVCRQVLTGLQYIHEKLKISHGSIKLSDLLLANIGQSMLQGKTLEHKREDLKGLALVLIHLKNPHTILEDGRTHVNNPRDVSREAYEFIDMTKSATYRELFQKFLHIVIMDTSSSDLATYFRGFAKLHLGHIVSDTYNEKNVRQYLRLFKTGQYSREDPLHTIAVTIVSETLVRAVSQHGIDASTLYDPRTPPLLTLEQDIQLPCLQGRDLLEAAKRSLGFGEKWWVVRLYSADSEILQSLWSQDNRSVMDWKAKTGTSYTYVRRVYENRDLRYAIGALLPYTGLWDSFTLRKLDYVIGSHSLEEMAHYLQKIYKQWSILEAPVVESASVDLIEGKDSERTLRQALLGSWNQIPGEDVTIQDTEFYFDKISLNRVVSELEHRHAAWISYLQLWMSAFRHFIDPRRGKEGEEPGVQPLLDIQGKADFEFVANKLGFNKRFPRSTRYPVFQYISRTLTNNGSVESERVSNVRDRFVQTFPESQDFSRARDISHEWSTNIDDQKSTFRAGRPEVEEFRKLRQYFYFKIVGNDDGSPKSYPTAIAVMREIFFDFFGRFWLESISSPVEMEHHPAVSPSIYSVSTELAEPAPLLMESNGVTAVNEVSRLATQALVPMNDVSLESAPPKAAGFEDDENIGPLAELCYISHHRGSREIIEKWYHDRDPDLVVLFLFDRRAFYKFRRNSNKELSDRIHYLAQENYFFAICDNVKSIPYQETVAALLKFSLLLVGSKDGPTRTIAREGALTLKDLEEFVVLFDPKTGKRRPD